MTKTDTLEAMMDVLTDPEVSDETERKLTYILNVVTDEGDHADDETNTETGQHEKRVTELLKTAERIIHDHRRSKGLDRSLDLV